MSIPPFFNWLNVWGPRPLEWHKNEDCEWAMNCDFYGNDLAQKPMAGEQAGSESRKNPECTHFTWANGVCYMKKGPISKDQARYAPGKVSGIVHRETPRGTFTWKRHGDCEWAHDCEFRGNDLEAKPTTGEEAGSESWRNPECTHFTWADGVCYMKKGPISKDQARHAPGMVSGIFNRKTPRGTRTWRKNRDCEWAHDCEFRGNDLEAKPMAGEEAGRESRKNPECTHFTWADGVCYMKKGPISKDQARHAPGMVSGIVNRDDNRIHIQSAGADENIPEEYLSFDPSEAVSRIGRLVANFSFQFETGANLGAVSVDSLVDNFLFLDRSAGMISSADGFDLLYGLDFISIKDRHVVRGETKEISERAFLKKSLEQKSCFSMNRKRDCDSYNSSPSYAVKVVDIEVLREAFNDRRLGETLTMALFDHVTGKRLSEMTEEEEFESARVRSRTQSLKSEHFGRFAFFCFGLLLADVKHQLFNGDVTPKIGDFLCNFAAMKTDEIERLRQDLLEIICATSDSDQEKARFQTWYLKGPKSWITELIQLSKDGQSLPVVTI